MAIGGTRVSVGNIVTVIVGVIVKVTVVETVTVSVEVIDGVIDSVGVSVSVGVNISVGVKVTGLPSRHIKGITVIVSDHSNPSEDVTLIGTTSFGFAKNSGPGKYVYFGIPPEGINLIITNGAFGLSQFGVISIFTRSKGVVASDVMVRDAVGVLVKGMEGAIVRTVVEVVGYETVEDDVGDSVMGSQNWRVLVGVTGALIGVVCPQEANNKENINITRSTKEYLKGGCWHISSLSKLLTLHYFITMRVNIIIIYGRRFDIKPTFCTLE